MNNSKYKILKCMYLFINIIKISSQGHKTKIINFLKMYFDTVFSITCLAFQYFLIGKDQFYLLYELFEFQ